MKQGLVEYEQEAAAESGAAEKETDGGDKKPVGELLDAHESSVAAVNRCKRAWFIYRLYVRPLPKEALEEGALSLSKKDKATQNRRRTRRRRRRRRAGGKIPMRLLLLTSFVCVAPSPCWSPVAAAY